MKKFFLFVAAAMTAMTMSAAYSLNNPVGADGRYIVKYDLKTNSFATANDMKVNETFVFAVDVTGTWLETFLNGTPTAEGAQRGLAILHWTNLGDVNGDASRMKRISGNIWGMTVNYWQIATGDFSKALMKDSTLYVTGQIFGFEYTKDNSGANWWMWEDQPADVTLAEGSDCLFAFALSTETTAQEGDEEFYSTDYMEDMYGYDVKGYAAPCAKIGTDILVHNLTGWDNLYLYMWGDGGNDLGGGWPGFMAQREDEGDLIFLVAEGEYDGKSESLVFNNGNGLQLADYPITLGDSYELWVTLDGVFDKEPVSALSTFNVTVPAGTDACYLVGSMNSWNINEPVAMTKVDDTHYTYTAESDLMGAEYKYVHGADWAKVEKAADGSEMGNRVVDAEVMNDTVERWADATGLFDVKANATADKFLYNGQLMIRKDGKTYNAMGVEVK